MGPGQKGSSQMTEKKEILIILITCSQAQGPELARKLVQEGLAACVNQIPGIWSTYVWEGQVQTDQECLLMAKTTPEAYQRLEKRSL